MMELTKLNPWTCCVEMVWTLSPPFFPLLCWGAPLFPNSREREPDLLMLYIEIFFYLLFSVISSFREWNSFCAFSLLLHIHLLDYCSPETLTVFFFLYWWVQFVALISPDAIILCPTHATLCFNFQTIALTCSILRSYVFIETLFLCLPLYLQSLCRLAAANFMDS